MTDGFEFPEHLDLTRSVGLPGMSSAKAAMPLNHGGRKEEKTTGKMKRKRQERENPGLQGVRILFMLFIFTIGLSVGMPFGRAGKADSDPKPVK